MINRKDQLFQSKRKSASTDYETLNLLTLNISNTIISSTLKCHERLLNKPNDPKTGQKTYWKILKTFASGSQILVISPLLVSNLLVTDFLVRAN